MKRNMMLLSDQVREKLMAKEATFELIPQAIRFFYPKGLTYNAKTYAAK